MPLFRTQVFKSIGGGKEWSNSYWIDAADITAADFMAGEIAIAEQSVHKGNVDFLRARTSTAAPGDNAFVVRVLNFPGSVPADVPQLPLFNTVRVDLGVFGGRASFKYLRTPIAENEQENGLLAPSTATFIAENYVLAMLSLSANTPPETRLVDEDGNSFTSGSVNIRVQNRQLRRRRRRRASGGIGQS